LFAYQTKQQVSLFLKDLIPLAAIGRAYVWRAGEQDNETTDNRTTRQGKDQRAEGKALRECVLPEVRGRKSEIRSQKYLFGEGTEHDTRFRLRRGYSSERGAHGTQRADSL